MMKAYFVAILFSLFSFNQSYAIDAYYSAKNISEFLLKNANAVIRQSTTSINVISNTEIYETRHYIITILNEEGSKYALVRQSYNKQLNVESIKGKIYDVNGKELGKVKESAITDISITGEAFFDDYRYKVFEFHYATYPYTCDFEVTIKLNSSLFLPVWEPQFDYDCAVEKAEVVVNYPKGLPLRYRFFHVKDNPVLTTENDQNKLSIAVNNLAAHSKLDDFTPMENFQDPAMIIAIDRMSLLGFDGDMTTWRDLGNFIYNLNANRDDLPEQTKKYVHQLTDTCTTISSKINLLYRYLQQNTRYVNIILGIGGWQTLPANFVAEKGYGDCKALSNFMKALLKEAGITSYQTLVYGSHEKVRTMLLDFPYSTFNHVILCVPEAKDTIWLECTAKNLPAGYLSSFTSNRNVLILTPNGGYVTRTPAYKGKTNVLVRVANISINGNDEVHGSIIANYSGYWWDKENNIGSDGKLQQDNYFNSKFAIPTYAVGNYKLTSGKTNNIPFINEEIPVSGEGMTSKTGGRVFVAPRVFNFAIPQGGGAESRKDSFELLQDYCFFDTTTITLKVLMKQRSWPPILTLIFRLHLIMQRASLNQEIS